jgi:hypothetical protein
MNFIKAVYSNWKASPWWIKILSIPGIAVVISALICLLPVIIFMLVVHSTSTVLEGNDHSEW